jgi:alkaline phosphatase
MITPLSRRIMGCVAAALMMAGCCLTGNSAYAQALRTRIFAHNDYIHSTPFYGSYDFGVDYIEADIFLKRGKLFVAHTAIKIEEDRTLAELYLMPLLDKINENNGTVYPEPEKTLTLMVDLKTDGAQTLQALVDELNRFPTLIKCRTLAITISGNVPPPAEWSSYPEYIHFDGRPTISYSADQLRRVTLISASFKDYSSWNGRGEMSSAEHVRLEAAVNEVHALGKPVRFWAAPDFAVAWRLLITLGVDVINTDDVEGFLLYQKE